MTDTIDPVIDELLFKIARQNGISQPRLEVSACSGAGDNYVGKVYRAILSDEDGKQQINLVAKTPPTGKNRREILRVDVYFQNEARTYEKILPALAERYKRRGLMEKDAPFLNAPRSYASITERGDSDVIILEDMRPRGFVMGDRKKGLDGEHCRLVVRELARLHAASMELQRRDPDHHKNLVNELTENFFEENDEHKSSFNVEDYLSKRRDMIKERFPEGTIERSKFEEFGKDFIGRMRRFVHSHRDSKLRTITHGDAWVNNLLFRYNKETSKPEAVCLIDFQICRFASPALDLSYFMFNSTTKPVRDKHYDDLMKGYHQDLTKFLEDLEMDANEIAPWDLFQEEMRKYGGYGWGMAMFVVPLFMAAKEDIVGVDDDISRDNIESAFLKNRDRNELLEERLSDILEDVVRLGLI